MPTPPYDLEIEKYNTIDEIILTDRLRKNPDLIESVTLDLFRASLYAAAGKIEDETVNKILQHDNTAVSPAEINRLIREIKAKGRNWNAVLGTVAAFSPLLPGSPWVGAFMGVSSILVEQTTANRVADVEDSFENIHDLYQVIKKINQSAEAMQLLEKLKSKKPQLKALLDVSADDRTTYVDSLPQGTMKELALMIPKLDNAAAGDQKRQGEIKKLLEETLAKFQNDIEAKQNEVIARAKKKAEIFAINNLAQQTIRIAHFCIYKVTQNKVLAADISMGANLVRETILALAQFKMQDISPLGLVEKFSTIFNLGLTHFVQGKVKTNEEIIIGFLQKIKLLTEHIDRKLSAGFENVFNSLNNIARDLSLFRMETAKGIQELELQLKMLDDMYRTQSQEKIIAEFNRTYKKLLLLLDLSKEDTKYASETQTMLSYGEALVEITHHGTATAKLPTLSGYREGALDLPMILKEFKALRRAENIIGLIPQIARILQMRNIQNERITNPVEWGRAIEYFVKARLSAPANFNNSRYNEMLEDLFEVGVQLTKVLNAFNNNQKELQEKIKLIQGFQEKIIAEYKDIRTKTEAHFRAKEKIEAEVLWKGFKPTEVLKKHLTFPVENWFQDFLLNFKGNFHPNELLFLVTNVLTKQHTIYSIEQSNPINLAQGYKLVTFTEKHYNNLNWDVKGVGEIKAQYDKTSIEFIDGPLSGMKIPGVKTSLTGKLFGKQQTIIIHAWGNEFSIGNFIAQANEKYMGMGITAVPNFLDRDGSYLSNKSNSISIPELIEIQLNHYIHYKKRKYYDEEIKSELEKLAGKPDSLFLQFDQNSQLLDLVFYLKELYSRTLGFNSRFHFVPSTMNSQYYSFFEQAFLQDYRLEREKDCKRFITQDSTDTIQSKFSDNVKQAFVNIITRYSDTLTEEVQRIEQDTTIKSQVFDFRFTRVPQYIAKQQQLLLGCAAYLKIPMRCLGGLVPSEYIKNILMEYSLLKANILLNHYINNASVKIFNPTIVRSSKDLKTFIINLDFNHNNNFHILLPILLDRNCFKNKDNFETVNPAWMVIYIKTQNKKLMIEYLYPTNSEPFDLADLIKEAFLANPKVFFTPNSCIVGKAQIPSLQTTQADSGAWVVFWSKQVVNNKKIDEDYPEFLKRSQEFDAIYCRKQDAEILQKPKPSISKQTVLKAGATLATVCIGGGLVIWGFSRLFGSSATADGSGANTKTAAASPK